MPRSHTLTVLLFALAGAPALAAQATITNLETGAQFAALQPAIDAAGGGDRIRIQGGSHGPISITRSVVLLGEQNPTIAAPPGGGCTQPAAITIRGDGSTVVVLSGLTVGGTATFPTCTPGAGIDAQGLAELRVYRSTVTGHVYTGVLTGILVSVPGIAVPPAESPFLLISDSAVTGTASGSDGTIGFTPAGAAAIDAPSAEVVATGSVLTGGDGGDSYLMLPPQPNLCPCAFGGAGAGGDAVVAREYWSGGTAEKPGTGGLVYVGAVYWGKQPDGRPVNAVNEARLGFPISSANPPRIGQSWSLQFRLLAGSSSALVVGRSARPQPLAGGWLCLDPGVLYLTIGLGATATGFQSPVPNRPGLAGLELGMHVATLTFNQVYLSRPVFEQVTF